ncbi:hypothetical protein BJ546DRAFT_236719 [Cryomyces antarcticus]
MDAVNRLQKTHVERSLAGGGVLAYHSQPIKCCTSPFPLLLPFPIILNTFVLDCRTDASTNLKYSLGHSNISSIYIPSLRMADLAEAGDALLSAGRPLSTLSSPSNRRRSATSGDISLLCRRTEKVDGDVLRGYECRCIRTGSASFPVEQVPRGSSRVPTSFEITDAGSRSATGDVKEQFSNVLDNSQAANLATKPRLKPVISQPNRSSEVTFCTPSSYAAPPAGPERHSWLPPPKPQLRNLPSPKLAPVECEPFCDCCIDYEDNHAHDVGKLRSSGTSLLVLLQETGLTRIHSGAER